MVLKTIGVTRTGSIPVTRTIIIRVRSVVVTRGIWDAASPFKSDAFDHSSSIPRISPLTYHWRDCDRWLAARGSKTKEAK